MHHFLKLMPMDRCTDTLIHSFIAPDTLHICAKLQLSSSLLCIDICTQTFAQSTHFLCKNAPHTATDLAMKSTTIHTHAINTTS